jgi:5'(3')-deoxyribonucleotidase
MKDKLFLDFDSVIVNTVKSFCETYNLNYFNHPNFKPADYHKNKEWNFQIQCPLINHPLDIFNHPLFFSKLEFMPDAEEVIKELCNKYQVIICSLGSYENISQKASA